MNAITFTLTLLIIVGMFIFFLLWFVLIVDSILRGHDLTTSRRATKVLFKIISEQKTAKNFYDLGCARGALAVRVKRKFPALSIYAIDNNPIRIFFAKIRAFIFRQNIKFLRKNIFDVDLSDADIIYAYLWYDLMPSLEKKLQNELKRGAVVITNTSNFPNWKPVRKVITHSEPSGIPDYETLFVYIKS